MASTNGWTHETESSVDEPRLFRAGVMDWHTLAPKLAPHVVASAHPVEGEGGIGSVMQFNFTSAMPFGLTKERLEFLDTEKCECKSTFVKGGRVETATSHIKMEPVADGGSVAKVDSAYKLLPGMEVTGSKRRRTLSQSSSRPPSYLIINPDAYN